MMDFNERLEKAIARGRRRGEAQARAAEEAAISEAELRRLHSQYRLQLSEHIEHCIKRLPDAFPGFAVETIYGDRGWGAACSRDDIDRGRGGKADTFFSRLEMTIRPPTPMNVLELSAKGAIRNRELFQRSHYEKLVEADLDRYVELIDNWILEYAELYAANT